MARAKAEVYVNKGGGIDVYTAGPGVHVYRGSAKPADKNGSRRKKKRKKKKSSRRASTTVKRRKKKTGGKRKGAGRTKKKKTAAQLRKIRMRNLKKAHAASRSKSKRKKHYGPGTAWAITKLLKKSKAGRKLIRNIRER
jgi:hypothetical protein